jgi:hypothetical protein
VRADDFIRTMIQLIEINLLDSMRDLFHSVSNESSPAALIDSAVRFKPGLIRSSFWIRLMSCLILATFHLVDSRPSGTSRGMFCRTVIRMYSDADACDVQAS